MPTTDLNKTMDDLQSKSEKLRRDILDFLTLYENLVREVNTIYVNEQVDAGSTEDLGEFYRLLQTLKRNRDVVGSVVRGFNNIRPTAGFRFVEEELESKKAEMIKEEKKNKKRTTKKKEKVPQFTESIATVEALEPEEVFTGLNL